MEDKNLYMMLGEMHSDIKAIKEQTTKTNGRVTILEATVRSNSDWILTFKTRAALVTGGISLAFVVVWEFTKEWLKGKLQ